MKIASTVLRHDVLAHFAMWITLISISMPIARRRQQHSASADPWATASTAGAVATEYGPTDLMDVPATAVTPAPRLCVLAGRRFERTIPSRSPVDQCRTH